MADRSTTLIQGGVTNAIISSALSTYLAMDPATIHQYFNDFDTFNSGDWTLTSSNVLTNALTAGNGGLLQMSTNAASASVDQLTLTVATFAFNPATAQVWFKTRFAVTNATNAQIYIGLQNLNTNASAATDGVWFQKLAASTTGNFVASASSTATTSTQGVTLANATYIDVGFYYDGASPGEINLYANNGSIGKMSSTNVPATTTNLALTMAVQNGTAATESLYVDYILAAVERDVPAQQLLA
jgi:hypothetical protein